jgi:Polyketide cyclase / dehydrase and lipid transport
MKWLLYISAAFIALLLLITLIGLLLPKAHHATRMARFRQPPEEIFAAITGPQDWRGVKVTELPPIDGRRGWIEQSGRHSITFEEIASDPPRLYRSQIADKNLPFSGTWTWEITATGDGCICRITEDGEVSNPIFRFVSQLILGHTKSIQDYFNAMGKKFNQTINISQ